MSQARSTRERGAVVTVVAVLLAGFGALTELDRTFPTQTPGYFFRLYPALVSLYQRCGRADEGEKWRQRGMAFAEELKRRDRPVISHDLTVALEKLDPSVAQPQKKAARN